MASKKTWNKKLNQNQIKFCEYYVTEEFFCNWTKSYMKAYPNSSEETARRNSSDLLTNTDILDYIDSLLQDMGFNDQRVDKELMKMMLQDDDRISKMKAIDLYYKISSRIEKWLSKAVKSWDVDKDVLPKIVINWEKNNDNIIE